jgi:sialidase-1
MMNELMHVDVFTSGQDGFCAYRIPALAVARDGTILAFAEARKNHRGDPGTEGNELHQVVKRSRDQGKTWSAMTVIEAPGTLWSAGNPAAVCDRETGRIWLHYIRCRPACGSGQARPGTDDIVNLVRYSDDEGATWSAPEDITAVCRDMASPTWRCTVVGPGGGIQDRQGRLVFACWKQDEPRGVFAVFSEDHGKTWQRGACVPDAPDGVNEDQVVELADGRLLLDCRQALGTHRWLAISEDGGRTWSKSYPGPTVSPVCCAIERFTLKGAGDDADRIIWTGPRGPGRTDLVVRVSEDEGISFPRERLIAAGSAAYSDMERLADKRIGVLWERENYGFITFTVLDRAYLACDGNE